MQIKDINDLALVRELKPAAAAGNGQGTPASGQAGQVRADRVTSDQSAQAAQMAIAAAQQAGSGRSVKLDQLAAAIRAGSYLPDPTRIAEQLISDAQLTVHLRAMLGE